MDNEVDMPIEASMTIRVTHENGMTNIDCSSISYGNIKHMYTTGDGHGLQLNQNQEHKRGEILDICAKISDALQELEEVLKR